MNGRAVYKPAEGNKTPSMHGVVQPNIYLSSRKKTVAARVFEMTDADKMDNHVDRIQLPIMLTKRASLYKDTRIEHYGGGKHEIEFTSAAFD